MRRKMNKGISEKLAQVLLIRFSHLLSDSIRGCDPWYTGRSVRNSKIWTTRSRPEQRFLTTTARAHCHTAPARQHYCPCPPASDYLLGLLALFKDQLTSFVDERTSYSLLLLNDMDKKEVKLYSSPHFIRIAGS